MHLKKPVVLPYENVDFNEVKLQKLLSVHPLCTVVIRLELFSPPLNHITGVSNRASARIVYYECADYQMGLGCVRMRWPAHISCFLFAATA